MRHNGHSRRFGKGLSPYVAGSRQGAGAIDALGADVIKTSCSYYSTVNGMYWERLASGRIENISADRARTMPTCTGLPSGPPTDKQPVNRIGTPLRVTTPLATSARRPPLVVVGGGSGGGMTIPTPTQPTPTAPVPTPTTPPPDSKATLPCAFWDAADSNWYIRRVNGSVEKVSKEEAKMLSVLCPGAMTEPPTPVPLQPTSTPTSTSTTRPAPIKTSSTGTVRPRPRPPASPASPAVTSSPGTYAPPAAEPTQIFVAPQVSASASAPAAASQPLYVPAPSISTPEPLVVSSLPSASSRPPWLLIGGVALAVLLLSRRKST